MSDKLDTILYIDDEEDILELTEMTLEAVGGYSVETCNRGQKGIDKALDMDPDLILIDVMMPEMDGPTTLAKMREHETLRDKPVIFMTARIQPDEIKEYMDKGAIDVVAKPFDPMTLSDQIKEAWEKYND